MAIQINSIELKKVLLFLKDNTDKLYLPSTHVGKYSIDADQINKLFTNIRHRSCLNQNEINDSILFLKRVFDIMRYVSFDEFLCVINKISKEIEKYLLENYKKYHIIFFCGLDDSILKSYTWILFLFLNEMNIFFNSNKDIVNKIFVANQYVFPNSEQEHDNKILYLFFDDMSYSGRQIYDELPNEEFTNDNIDIYITVPFISQTAINKFSNNIDGERKKNKRLKYWKNTQIINSLENLFFENLEGDISNYRRIFLQMCNISENISENIFYKSFQCYSRLIPIYFDHKIADCLSTFQKIIYFGSYPVKSNRRDCEPKCIREPLIKSCIANNNEYNKGKNFCTDTLIDMENTYTCPKTFYKSNIYLLKGDNIQRVMERFGKQNYNQIKLIELLKFYETEGKLEGEELQEQQSSETKKKDALKKYHKYKKKYLELKKLVDK